MRFGIFYEHQLPRPWADDRTERQVLRDALEQVEIADRVGFDYVWEVEHHFLEEYSHSSAPEVFLAALSQRTERIRLGHGIVQIPPAVNHPARVAERVATLDLLSDGRVDFGTGESSSAAELGGFLVDRSQKRAQWKDAMDAITRMFVEEPFAGWDSEYFQMPPRNVIPKPLQKPHPPLWVACSRRETIHFAARKGLGALAFSFVEPEDAAKWAEEYYDLVRSPECVPIGFAVEPNLTVVLPMMCHEDEQVAIDRGIDGAHFFGYSLMHYYGMGTHRPGVTNVWEEFLRNRAEKGFAREIVTAEQGPLAVKLLQQGLGSLRGAIGTPDQITDLVQRYADAGIDQMVFVLQAGPNKHDDICEGLELFGEKVIPRFAEDAEAWEKEKGEALRPAIEAALARREPAREPPAGYVVDEAAELERARRARRRPGGLRERAAELAGDARGALEKQGQAALARLVSGASDEQLERRFGTPLAQRAVFTAMARAFDPKMAFGFKGDIVYELEHFADGVPSRPPESWTLRVDGGRATAIRGGSPDPALTVRVAVPDFARLIAGETNPARLLFDGRFEVEGDFQVASRLSEMFGGPAQF
jgi:alkanesulfonate monooxygenase SsuD/methylene tetrahydromethanopterin reductase-like flavin-dependent oxidoreductase (luciferase family)